MERWVYKNEIRPRLSGSERTTLTVVTISPHSIYAVLTGDVVDSEAMSAAGGPTVGSLLRGATAAAQGTFPEAGISAVDIFRGDSWQLYLENPAWAGRVAWFIRAWVRASGSPRSPFADTRLAIGLGTVSRLVPDRVSESEGEAFVVSGRALDALTSGKPRRGARWAIAGLGDITGAAGDAIVALADVVAGGWTPKQAWALCGAWQGLTQTEIGATFGPQFGEAISQMTVAAHLRAGGFEAMEVALDWLSQTIPKNCV